MTQLLNSIAWALVLTPFLAIVLCIISYWIGSAVVAINWAWVGTIAFWTALIWALVHS